MPLLAIDVGNSRIKWGLHDSSRWIEQGAVEHARAQDLEAAWLHLGAAWHAIGSNVSTPSLALNIETMLRLRGVPIRWIESRRDQCGVHNLYRDVRQLGTDRWAALIAARALHSGACLVISAGTAVTVDALTARGYFLGGLILPGLQLMRDALVRDTARLASDAGTYADFPRTTADAIASGAINAVAGAVEHYRTRLRGEVGGSVGVLATGGAIGTLGPHLGADTRFIENLVLEGLLIIAADS